MTMREFAKKLLVHQETRLQNKISLLGRLEREVSEEEESIAVLTAIVEEGDGGASREVPDVPIEE